MFCGCQGQMDATKMQALQIVLCSITQNAQTGLPGTHELQPSEAHSPANFYKLCVLLKLFSLKT